MEVFIQLPLAHLRVIEIRWFAECSIVFDLTCRRIEPEPPFPEISVLLFNKTAGKCFLNTILYL